MEKFKVELELEYDMKHKDLRMTKNIKINGFDTIAPDGEPNPDKMGKLLGQIAPTIILAEGGNPADPCAWIWNPTLERWFWRCW